MVLTFFFTSRRDKKMFNPPDYCDEGSLSVQDGAYHKALISIYLSIPIITAEFIGDTKGQIYIDMRQIVSVTSQGFDTILLDTDGCYGKALFRFNSPESKAKFAHLVLQ